MNLKSIITVAALVTVFTTNVFAAKTNVIATAPPSTGRTIKASIRTLTATAWCLINELPPAIISESQKDSNSTLFENKKIKILSAIKSTISSKKVPDLEKLKKIREWILKLHSLAMKTNVYEDNSMDLVLFTGNMSVAEGYIDCALLMAKNIQE